MICIFVWGVLRFWPRWLSAEIVKRNVSDCLIITPLHLKLSFFVVCAAFGEPVVSFFVAGAVFCESMCSLFMACAAFGTPLLSFFVAGATFGEPQVYSSGRDITSLHACLLTQTHTHIRAHQLEADLQAELRSHVEQIARKNVAKTHSKEAFF